MEELWLARDKSGRLFLYYFKPRKSTLRWVCVMGDRVCLSGLLFPDVQWSDEEPTKVKLVIEK